jgi:hypothetical protein
VRKPLFRQRHEFDEKNDERWVLNSVGECLC